MLANFKTSDYIAVSMGRSFGSVGEGLDELEDGKLESAAAKAAAQDQDDDGMDDEPSAKRDAQTDGAVVSLVYRDPGATTTIADVLKARIRNKLDGLTN